MKTILTIFIILIFSVTVHAGCIIIDIGHTEKLPGAMGATGIQEIRYNQRVGYGVRDRLERDGYKVVVIENVSLADRVKKIEKSSCDFFISIHHDSVQPILNPKDYSGYSMFIMIDRNYCKNYLLAYYIGTELNKRGFQPSLYHAMDIPGERKKILIEEIGLHNAGFYILKHTNKPGLLLECGVIANKEEAEKLNDPVVYNKIIDAIVSAVPRLSWVKK